MGVVSGRVLFDGRPLPGGKVLFRLAQSGDVREGIIDENGGYTVDCPAGEAQIGVDNSMLQKPVAPGPQRMRGAGVRPGSGEKPNEFKGRYVSIPSKFKNPVTSGLTYTVEKGGQTHDIPLK
jgi:hypothetical protein